MTEQELQRLLARLVARDTLSQAEADAVLDAFGDGTLDVAWPDAATALAPLYDDLAAAAILAALYGALGRLAARSRGAERLARLFRSTIKRGAESAYQALAALPPAQGRDLAEALLATFDREARRRAALIPSYRDGVRRFHVAMRQAVRQDTLALAQLGTGRPLSPAQRARLTQRLRVQDAYLQRFVEEVAAREAVAAAGGRAAMSEKQIAARARTYAGSARGAYFEAAQGQYEGRAGFVIHFEGADDPNNCSACAAAMDASPYLPGQAPNPGDVCFGGGLCRHYLRVEESPALYAELTRRRAA